MPGNFLFFKTIFTFDILHKHITYINCLFQRFLQLVSPKESPEMQRLRTPEVFIICCRFKQYTSEHWWYDDPTLWQRSRGSQAHPAALERWPRGVLSYNRKTASSNALETVLHRLNVLRSDPTRPLFCDWGANCAISQTLSPR